MPREDIAFWGATLLALIGIYGFVRKTIIPPLQRLNRLVRDLTGEDARPGFAAKPGIMERMDSVEHAAHDAMYNSKPNGGNSAYDRMMKQMRSDNEEIRSDVATLISTFADHIAESTKDREGLHREINMFKVDRSEHHHDN